MSPWRPTTPTSSLRTVVAGLGGRPITRRSLEAMLADAGEDELEPLTFLDLDHADGRARARPDRRRRGAPGPSAENVLRDLGTVAPGSVEEEP